MTDRQELSEQRRCTCTEMGYGERDPQVNCPTHGASPEQRRSPAFDGSVIDTVCFSVIVHRLRRPTEHGKWLVRVYLDAEHIHSAEGGVSLDVGLGEAKRAMLRYVEEAGFRS